MYNNDDDTNNNIIYIEVYNGDELLPGKYSGMYKYILISYYLIYV